MIKSLVLSIMAIVLTQNAFAQQQWRTDLEKCEIETRTPKTANVNVCLKSIRYGSGDEQPLYFDLSIIVTYVNKWPFIT